uniref:arginine kinase n=1 Tax=Onchocerca volvulus TaxID=6282 RepID=A0A8R1TQJ7_ONCVO
MQMLVDTSQLGEEDHLRIISMQKSGNVGQHSESASAVYDISNKIRFGLKEFEAVKQMHDGVKQLIEMEKKA